METSKVRIMHHHAIQAKLRRMAYQIYEKNFEETELVFVGINTRGSHIAKRLIQLLEEISPLNLHFLHAEKNEAGTGVELDPNAFQETIPNRTVIVVDDVLYSGGTMLSAVSQLMPFKPAKIRIAVLIDRGHRNYPLSPDYLGMDLATTLKQHVSVEVAADDSKVEAFLL